MILLAVAAARAEPVQAELHGDVKSFFVASFPSEWIAPPEIPPALEPFLPPGTDGESLLRQAGLAADPQGQGIADFRLKLVVESGPLRLDLHHAVSALPSSGSGGALGSSAGVALTAPELVDLTWQANTDPALILRGRTDRALLTASIPHLVIAVGRQPVSFGAGMFFTPMDVVNPFSAATIDTEYKPGVDAVRIDGFAGVSSRVTAVAAWSGPTPFGDPDFRSRGLGDVILALSGGGTIGTTDLFGLVSVARAEPVVGLGFAGGLGPIGLHGEATVTVPAEDAAETDPFVRAVLGGDGRPTGTTTISTEVYLQTHGAADPSGYLERITGPRFARGEIWQAGRLYAAVAVAQEITPLVSGSLALIGNLEDPSALVAPGLSWSIADEVVLGFGLYAGLGARPDRVPLTFDPATFQLVPPTTAALADSVNSEFGLYPVAGYLQLRAYF